MSTAETKRPVQLQVNNSGAWKTVIRFDAGDERRAVAIQLAAKELFINGGRDTNWRIVTAEGHPIVRRFMGRDTNGIWISRELS